MQPASTCRESLQPGRQLRRGDKLEEAATSSTIWHSRCLDACHDGESCYLSLGLGSPCLCHASGGSPCYNVQARHR